MLEQAPRSELKSIIGKFIDSVLSSSSVVALTGAGISTESGIPDYRSPETGLWERMDQSIVSLEGFLKDPSRYYSYALELYPLRRTAKPNAAHYLLAELEKRKILKGIITQNIDGLHQEAGSTSVYEIHGSLRRAVCLACATVYSMDEIMFKVSKGENPPLCEKCKGVVKPDAVFFGEALPQDAWERSVNLVRNSDLLLVIGSSLQVYPANILPDIALKAGAKLIIANLMPTPYDGYASLVIRYKIGEFAGAVLKALKENGF
jgi:NAD-dependent deacetylase